MSSDFESAATRRAAAEAAARQAAEEAVQRLADATRRKAADAQAQRQAAAAARREATPAGETGQAAPEVAQPGEVGPPAPGAEPSHGVLTGFAEGLGQAALGLGGGLQFMAAHPLEAAQGLARLATSPEQLAAAGEKLWGEATAGGWAHAAGFVALSAAPLLLGPGGAIAVAGMAVEKLQAEPPR